MPVPDPGTGGDRWSVDLVFVDQSAIPTFVECKRMGDTRSRREVVAQMLEYAANGHHYWTAGQLLGYAKETATAAGDDLEKAVQALGPDNDLSAEELFEAVEANLREGQLRLVFFLEESPYEPRSIVEFLNSQMERSEVLIVEAKQFEMDGLRVVVPTLFGYTEQARLVKRPVTVSTGRGRRKWNEESFFEAARNALAEEEMTATERMFALSKLPGTKISWGTGRDTGSFGIVLPATCQRSLFTVWTDGTLTFQFAWLTGSPQVEECREKLRTLVEGTGIEIPEKKFPNISVSEWVPRADGLVVGLEDLIREFAEV